MTYEIRYTYRLACGTMIGDYGADRYIGEERMNEERANLAAALKQTTNNRVSKWATPSDEAVKKQIVKITATKFYL